MRAKKLLEIGIVGSIITALCCFTPALVLLLGAAGLSAWLAWLDAVLIPLLIVFLAITAFGVAGMVSAARAGRSVDESTQ